MLLHYTAWGAREPIQNNRVNFNLYAVPLWVKGSINLHPSAPLGVTFVGCDKSNQKHAFKYGARGIKMTALRGKSRISLPLRLQLSCADPIFPSVAAFICKQERRVGINLRCKSV